MVDKLTYKGFVCTSGSIYRLIVKDSIDDRWFRTLPVNGRDEDFEDLNDFTASIVCVKFFDGTEQISMQDAVENNFDDIFMSITRNALIKVIAEKSIFDIISLDYKDMSKMWEFVDEYYNTDEGKKRFEEYVKKDVWNK
jgi:hypothetical protein